MAVVEDDDVQRRFLLDLLAACPHAARCEARSFSSAADFERFLVGGGRVDVLLCDISLGGAEGPRVASEAGEANAAEAPPP